MSAASLLTALLALSLAPVTAQAQLARLGIDLEGIEPTTGKVEVSVFATAEDFMKRPWLQQTLPVDGRTALRFEFAGLPPGQYAVVAVHDANDNDVYDAGFFGLGAEGLGYSNDAGPLLGRPAFSDAAFEVDSEDVDIVINVE